MTAPRSLPSRRPDSTNYGERRFASPWAATKGPSVEDARIRQLEQQVAELTALVERLAPAAVSEPAPADSASPLEPEVATPHDTASGSSRRGVLKLAGAAAVGAVAVAVAGSATPAAAATGGPMLIGGFNNADTATADTTFLLGGGLGVIVDSKAVTDAGISTYGAALFGRNIATNVDAIVRAGVLGMSSQANLSPGRRRAMESSVSRTG